MTILNITIIAVSSITLNILLIAAFITRANKRRNKAKQLIGEGIGYLKFNSITQNKNVGRLMNIYEELYYLVTKEHIKIK